MASKVPRQLLTWSKSVNINIQKIYSSSSIEFNAKPIHKPVGTFGSLTTVTQDDKIYQVNPAINTDRTVTDQEPLVIIFGWAGATHKVNNIFEGFINFNYFV